MAKMPKSIRELVEKLQKSNGVPVGKWPKEAWDAYTEKLRRNERPLVEALAEAGVSVNSVWDLVNTSTPYPKALPVLIDHLGGEYHPKVLAGIARALAVRDPFAVEHAWPVVLDLYLKTEDDKAKEPEMRGFKEALAVSISVLCTEERLPQVFRLIEDSSHGDSRGHLFYCLRKFRREKKVSEFLESLYDDPKWGELARDTTAGKSSSP